MRKFLFFFFLFVVSLCYTEEVSLRSEFLWNYYNGDFEDAHNLLEKVFPDEVKAAIWDERIHLKEKDLRCTIRKSQEDSFRGMAYLRIGQLEKARNHLDGEDWVSHLGQATLAYWNNRFESVSKHVASMLSLAPQRPEVLFFTATVSSAPEVQIEYFKKYLDVDPDEPVRKTVAEYSIAFLNKAKDLELNVVFLPSDFEKIDSRIRQGRPVMDARINGKKTTLALDTGAGGLSLIDKEWNPKITSDLVMVGLGKQEVVKGTRAVFDELTSGNLTVKNAVGAITPRMRSQGVDGVVGTILFSNYAILLPLKSKKQDLTLFVPSDEDPLQFLEKRGIKFSNKVTLPFLLVNRMIMLKGRIKKSDAQMDILLDTGAYATVLSASAARQFTFVNNVLSLRMQRQSRIVGIAGKPEKTLISENVDIQIGPLKKEYKRVIGVNMAEICESMELEVDAILGRDFLKDYALLIDYHNNKVTFLN